MYQLEHNLNYKYSMADLMHGLTSKLEHSAPPPPYFQPPLVM